MSAASTGHPSARASPSVPEKEDARKLLSGGGGGAIFFVAEAPTVGEGGDGGAFFFVAPPSARASASVKETYTTGDEIRSEERSVLEEIDNFPKDGVPSDLDHLFEKLADIYNDRGDRVGAMNVLLTLLEKYDPNK